jgi:magnesium-transporting ATPase (P-type)
MNGVPHPRETLSASTFLRGVRNNVLKGVGLGLVVATGFTVWITFLRLTAGTAPFERLDTTYAATVELYYAGGLVGGTMVGLLLPLRRSPWGSALLGMLGVFPLYFGVALTNSKRSQAFTLENVGQSAVLAFLVGGAVGVWTWLDANPHTSGWIEALRHPTSRTIGIMWAVVLAVAGGSYFGLSQLTGDWTPTLVVFLACVLFVIPLGLAALVTLLWTRERVK